MEYDIIKDENNDIKNILIELIKNVPQEVGLTIALDLKYSESFIKLENYSYELLFFAIELFESDDLCLNEKFIISFIVQKAEFDIFKYLLRDLAISFRNGKIDEEIIIWILFPEDFNYYIINNYNDVIVRESLNLILRSNKSSSDLKYAIRLLLDGTLFREMQ